MNDELERTLARIELMLEAQAKQQERLIMLLAAGHGKQLEELKKKSAAWLV